MRPFIAALTSALLGATVFAEQPPANANQAKPVESLEGKSPAEILEFMEKSLTLNPADDSPEAIQKAFEQAITTVLAAADKVLAHPKATEEQKTTAQQFRVDLLYQGAQAELPGMLDKLKALAAQFNKEMPKSEITVLANYRCISAVHGDEVGLDPAALPEVEKFIAQFPKETAAVSLLEGVIQSAEWSVQPEIGKKACDLIQKHFPEEAKELNIAGVKRRLECIGQPFKLEGTTRDGKPFDVKSLQGKVVLVDFWATWCGPCLAELPHLQEAYEKYRAKGFEIVGVSLDDEKESVDEFFKENPLPWTQLFEQDEKKRGFENPNVAHYGISAIPAMFLLDKSGRVVSTTIRGPFLEALLEDLLADKTAEQPADTTK